MKRGDRIVHGDKELLERLGRNDPCPCASGRRFQAVLHEVRPLRRVASGLLPAGLSNQHDVDVGANRSAVRVGVGVADSAATRQSARVEEEGERLGAPDTSCGPKTQRS